MAKARPKAPVRDRAICAFRKAHPAYTSAIAVYKRRGSQEIVVYGRNDNAEQVLGVWSYADNGSLRRVN